MPAVMLRTVAALGWHGQHMQKNCRKPEHAHIDHDRVEDRVAKDRGKLKLRRRLCPQDSRRPKPFGDRSLLAGLSGRRCGQPFSLIALDHSQHGLASVGRHTHAPLIGAVFEPVMVGGRQVKPNCLQCPSGHDSPFVGLFSRRLPNSHGSFFLSLLSRQLPNGHRSCFVGLPTRQVPNGNDLNSLGASRSSLDLHDPRRRRRRGQDIDAHDFLLGRLLTRWHLENSGSPQSGRQRLCNQSVYRMLPQFKRVTRRIPLSIGKRWK